METCGTLLEQEYTSDWLVSMQTTAYEEFPELKDFAQIIPALDSIIRYGDPLASLKWENKIICIKLSVEDDGISKKVEDDFSDYTVIE